MPHLKKNWIEKILSSINRSNQDFSTFIETGTYQGETATTISDNFNFEVYTIELSERYYNIAKSTLAHRPNLHLILGDSSIEIKKILENLSPIDNTIFWLDGHWSGGDTAQGEKDCPLLEECESIDNLYKANYGLILIDDFRLFGTKMNEDWSAINVGSILSCFKNHDTSFFIYNDVMVIEIQKK